MIPTLQIYQGSIKLLWSGEEADRVNVCHTYVASLHGELISVDFLQVLIEKTGGRDDLLLDVKSLMEWRRGEKGL